MSKNANFLNTVWQFIQKNSVMSGVAASILTGLISLAFETPITNLLKHFGIKNSSNTLIFILCVIAAAIVFLPLGYMLHLRKRIHRMQKEIQSLESKQETLESQIKRLEPGKCLIDIPERLGLIEVWDNFDSAKQEIKSRLLNQSVREVSILLHCEMGLAADSNNILGASLEELSSRPNAQQPTIRIIWPSVDNPYYTKPEYGLRERASKRISENQKVSYSPEQYISHRVETFRRKNEKLVTRLRTFKAEGLINIETRVHEQVYLWNIIIIDDYIFVQGDVSRSSLTNAPIMLFQDALQTDRPSRTYYYTFKKYFEDIWSYKSKEFNLKRRHF